MRDAKGGLRLCAMALVLLSSLIVDLRSVEAGCGCAKPAPPPGPIRPAFASPGREITLFAPSFVVGETYDVKFGAGVAVEATAVVKRDFADGVVKAQLVVPVPSLPPGPTAVAVARGSVTKLVIPDTDFTVLPPPLSLLEGHVKTVATSYQAVAGADGTIYIPLDISPIATAMRFRGRAIGHRLVFDGDDVVIYNTQGVLMQLLDLADEGVLYEIDDDADEGDDVDDDEGALSSARSFRMTYNRHEFETYRDKHEHDPDFAIDPTDPAWHANGSRHIEHHRLVIAIDATVVQNADGTSGSTAAPGPSPEFNFRIHTKPTDRPPGQLVKRSIDWATVVANPDGARAAIACSDTPLAPCRQPVDAGKGSLEIWDRADDRRDALVWRWKRGSGTTATDFGDMLRDHGLAVCLYDESGLTPTLVFGAMVDIGTKCSRGSKQRSCWRGLGTPRGSRGFRYRDRAAASGGIASIVLKPGDARKAGVVVKARGASLPTPTLPLALPLRMQLQTTTGQCWEDSFAGPAKKNAPGRFKAKSE